MASAQQTDHSPAAEQNSALTGWHYATAILFTVTLLVGLIGVVLTPGEKAPYLTVFGVSAGILLLVLAFPRLTDFSIGLEGVKGTLAKVEKKVDDLTKLQELQLQMEFTLNRDLLARRFAAYGDLWSKMEASAIYTGGAFGPTEVRSYSEDLTKWYFAPTGGILLTARAREFYFALQSLLENIGKLEGWQCADRHKDPRSVFLRLLETLTLQPEEQKALSLYKAKKPEAINEKAWAEVCKAVLTRIKALVTAPTHPAEGGKDAGATEPVAAQPPLAPDVIYCAIQQVSSVLRSNLTEELSSRLDIDWSAVRKQLGLPPAPGQAPPSSPSRP